MKVRKVKKQLKKLIDKKATPIGTIPVTTWVHQIEPKIASMLNRLGFLCSDGVYTKGVLILNGVINPWHIGYNQDGELRFCDAKVCKVSRRFILRNK